MKITTTRYERASDYALLDFKYYYSPNVCEYDHKLRDFKTRTTGFTGEIYKCITLKFEIFRFFYNITIAWDFKQKTPKEAYDIYHKKTKKGS